MKHSSRRIVRTACTIALVVGGIGLASAQTVIIERGAVMPAPRVEVIPVAPGPGFNWVPGHWAWRGVHWEWIPGHHVRGVVAARPAEVVEVVPVRPSPGHVWVKGHHVYEGGAWVWRPGVWVRL
jgi:WXXGXW repeat (2 copies)